MAEVELPNPEELEEIKGKTFTKRVALTTAIFAVIMAIASLGGNNATKEMLLSQQQASDQWAYYQAKSIREHQARLQKQRLQIDLADRGPAMKPEIRQQAEAILAEFAEQEKRYNTEKKEIETKAKELEEERDVNRTKDPYFDYAEVLLQIAVVMASISIISGSRPVFFFGLTLAIVGAFFTLDGYTLWLQLPILSGHHHAMT
jgi:hypothetical protein